jgi:hypothetical protein
MPDRRLADFLDLLDLPPTSVGRTNLFIRISLLREIAKIQMADPKSRPIRLKFRVVHLRPGNRFY